MMQLAWSPRLSWSNLATMLNSERRVLSSHCEDWGFQWWFTGESAVESTVLLSCCTIQSMACEKLMGLPASCIAGQFSKSVHPPVKHLPKKAETKRSKGSLIITALTADERENSNDTLRGSVPFDDANDQV